MVSSPKPCPACKGSGCLVLLVQNPMELRMSHRLRLGAGFWQESCLVCMGAGTAVRPGAPGAFPAPSRGEQAPTEPGERTVDRARPGSHSPVQPALRKEPT